MKTLGRRVVGMAVDMGDVAAIAQTTLVAMRLQPDTLLLRPQWLSLQLRQAAAAVAPEMDKHWD